VLAALRVSSEEGLRRVPIAGPRFRIGRDSENDLVLTPLEVSRWHAEIIVEPGRFLMRDGQAERSASKLGTWVNGARIVEHLLVHGDRIHLGGAGGADLDFEIGGAPGVAVRADPSTTTAVDGVGQLAALLAGLRALGGTRVLDDVLALVLDAALTVTGAERAFILLANAAGTLELKLARGRGRATLPTSDLRSHRVPEEVLATGCAQYYKDFREEIPDREQRDTVAFQLRTVVCLPIVAFDLADAAVEAGTDRRIGVIYLDSLERGHLLSPETRSALEALTANAAIAIENARLYRETLEKARLEHEIRVAAQIQRLLLPQAPHDGRYCRAAALTIPCRAIGGDVLDYVDPDGQRFVFAVGDVAGKGPPAALLGALVMGMFADQRTEARSPAGIVARINDALAARAIGARYVTLLCGQLTPDGRLTYCNAGHNPPLLSGEHGVRRLETGGPPAGMFDDARYNEDTVTLAAGDRLVVYTDGLSEARNLAGEEFGEHRILAAAQACPDDDPARLLAALAHEVQSFSAGAIQDDDITALVIVYRGPTVAWQRSQPAQP